MQPLRRAGNTILPALSDKPMAVNPLLLPEQKTTHAKPVVDNTPPKILSPRDLLFLTIRDHAILRGENQRLIGKSGKNNTWLVDVRRILMNATVMEAIADLFWEMCADKLPFQVGGMEVAAIPLVAVILLKAKARGTPVNGFIVRKERKTYGTGSLIEGMVTDAPIVIVDDILNSGKSLEKVRVVLEEYGKAVSRIFVLIDYHSARGEAWRNLHNIPVVAPFGPTDFGLTFGRASTPVPPPIFRNVWSFASPDPNFFHRVPKSFPATDGKRVYFGSDCGIFWCLNAHDGSVAWQFKVNTQGHKNIWSAPAIHDGRVYFGSYDGSVYCLDAETGAVVWRFTGADWVGSSPTLAPELGLLFIGLEFAVEGKHGSIVGFLGGHMPKAYSEDFRLRVVEAYRRGESADAFAKRFGVCIPCVYRWDNLLKETGALSPQYKAGDRSVIRDDKKFLAFAKAHAHSTLQQMADAWSDEVSLFAVSRKLKKLGITRKKTPTATKNVTKPGAKHS